MTTPEETCAVCQNKLPSSAHWFAFGYAAGVLSVLKSTGPALCPVHLSMVDHYLKGFGVRFERVGAAKNPFIMLGRNPVQQ